MKRHVLFLLLVAVSCTESLKYTSEESSESVDMEIPVGKVCVHLCDAGTLKDIISEWRSVDSLLISGSLNNEDVSFIRMMSGVDENGNETTGTLEYLDLADVEFKMGDRRLGDYCFSGCRVLKEIILPDNLIEIGDYAFKDCRNLTRVTIPDSLQVLGEGAFYNCTKLDAEIVIPKGVKAINDSTFYGCKKLKLLTLHDGIEHIADYAFCHCTSIDSIADLPRLKSLGIYSFAYAGIESFVLSDSINFIPKGAFAGCRQLKHVKSRNDIVSVRDSAFYYCQSLVDFEVSESLDSIGSFAFAWSALSGSLRLSKSLLYIGEGAFYNTNIKDVEVQKDFVELSTSSEKIIVTDVFGSCDSLKTIFVSEGVTALGLGFGYCDALTNIVLPSSLERIGYYSSSSELYGLDGIFSFCTALKQIELPESLLFISDRTFYGCSSLESIHIPKSVIEVGSGLFGDCTSLHSVQLEGAFQSSSYFSMYGIAHSMFSGCSTLKRITLPSEVQVISSFAFENCAALSELSLPDALLKISSGAFLKCLSIKEIKLPSLMEIIEHDAFRGCANLCKVDLNNSLKSIGAAAFFHCPDLKSIDFPESLTEIGDYAFSRTGLKQVYANWSRPLDIHQNVFEDIDWSSAELIVPSGTEHLYKQHPVWGQFQFIKAK